MPKRKNPILRRLDLVSDQWTAFAQRDEARLLVWLLQPDEISMLDTFLAVESDETGSLPDLFVELESAFDTTDAYSLALDVEFIQRARTLQSGLGEDEGEPWAPPPAASPASIDRALATWIATCDSFRQRFALTAHLAIVLRPTTVSNVGAFQLWLQKAAQESPPWLRYVVLDDVRRSELEALCRAEPVRVVATAAELDMPAARLEISREAGGLDTPGGQFRHLYVQLTNALGRGELEEARVLGDVALRVAAAQSWFALAVPIHFALGAALAAHGRESEARVAYESAEQAASDGERTGEATCTQLKLQARMARGGLLTAMRAYAEGAELWSSTIPFAIEQNNPRAALDCYRLASFCHEQDRQFDRAWQFGLDGLGYARKVDPETLATSTFPYLGAGLMRLAARPERAGTEARLEREIAEVAGRPDWRPRPPPPRNPAGAAA